MTRGQQQLADRLWTQNVAAWLALRFLLARMRGNK